MPSWNLFYLAALLSVSAALPQIVEPSISVGPPTTILSTVGPVFTATTSRVGPVFTAITSTVEPTSSGTAITTTVEPSSSSSTVAPTTSGTASSSTTVEPTTIPSTTVPPTTSVPPPTSTPVPSFRLHPNGNTAKCLEVRGDVRVNGTPVQIFDCNGTPAQNWVIHLGEGPVVLAGSNFCLDAGSAPANGVGMKIWECFSNLPAQDWFYTTDQRIALTNQGFCLDLTNGNLSNANQVQTFKCTDGDLNQVWTLGN